MNLLWRLRYIFSLFVWWLSWPVLGAQWQVKVTDHLGNPLKDAVVELISPTSQDDSNNHDISVQQDFKMVQQHKQFHPFVLAIPVGSKVDFPNLDSTRHHVYSFSKAKTFEIKLYKGRPHSPIVFDKSGMIALGCNIHDRMQAHIYVSSSPWVAVTDANGEAVFNELELTQYQVKLWHPWQRREHEIANINLVSDRVEQFEIFVVKPDTALVGAPRY